MEIINALSILNLLTECHKYLLVAMDNIGNNNLQDEVLLVTKLKQMMIKLNTVPANYQVTC